MGATCDGDNPLRFDHPLFDMFERFFMIVEQKINAKITIFGMLIQYLRKVYFVWTFLTRYFAGTWSASDDKVLLEL